MLRVLVLFVVSLFMATAALAEKRVALVIGNGAYANAVTLPNPPNDAADMAKKLAELDFQVIVGVDQTRDELEASLRKFALEARDATMTLFFYSGHGIQVDGHNYIIPIDAKLEDITALDFETIDADRIFSYMGGDGRIALAFLDACRDNPLSRRFARSLPKSRSNAVGVGLAMPQTVGTGLFIGFSTAPGDVALDGDGRNSPFTSALLSHIGEPGLEINGVMTRVKSDVQVATSGDQRPWTNSDLSTDVYLKRAIVIDPVVPDPNADGSSSGVASTSSGRQ